jgi:MarR family transcriptional regulator for hemolysin
MAALPIAPDAPGIDPDSVGFLISDLARLYRAAFERGVAAAGLGVTPSEARVLAHLARGGATRQHRLADRLGIAAMTLSGFLDRLEAQGLVERTADPADGRAKQVRLTAAAGPVLAGIAAVAAAARATARGGIAEADWALFRRLARTARDNLAAAARDRDAAA